MRFALISFATIVAIIALTVLGSAALRPVLAPRPVTPPGLVDTPVGPIRAAGHVDLHLEGSEEPYDAVQVMIGTYEQSLKMKLRICQEQTCVPTTRWPVDNQQMVLPLPRGMKGGTVTVFVDALTSVTNPGAEQIAFWGHGTEPMAIGLRSPSFSLALKELVAWR